MYYTGDGPHVREYPGRTNGASSKNHNSLGIVFGGLVEERAQALHVT